jgi:hypothetical protein
LKQELATNRQSLARPEQARWMTLTANLGCGNCNVWTRQLGWTVFSTGSRRSSARNIDALANAVKRRHAIPGRTRPVEGTGLALPALPALNANASSGIMTAATLEQRLGEIDKAAEGSGPGYLMRLPQPGGIWGMVQSKISSVVKVRSLDETDWSRRGRTGPGRR